MLAMYYLGLRNKLSQFYVMKLCEIIWYIMKLEIITWK